MSLFLTGSQDQALLALVVREASSVAENCGCFIGRTALQKIMYFLRVIDVPMSYRFDIYRYGPYCEEILKDVEWLCADEVIKDESTNPKKYSNYAPGETLCELLDMHREFVTSHLEPVQEVVHQLAPMGPERLELLATLDYLYRQLTASGGEGPWKDRVISRFLQVKGDKFGREDIEWGYNFLVGIRHIES